MTDLSSPVAIKAKGFLFLLLGVVSAVLVWLECPTLKLAGLLVLAIWSFCRFYYFAFYVIEKYVDSKFRFAGLWSFAMYLLRNKHPGS
jgi:hypothetical protein